MIRAYSNIDVAWARLHEYLGERFDSSLTDFNAACRYSELEADRLGSRFYADSDAYLYELTHFHFSGFKDGFFDALCEYAREIGVCTLVDIGCGIGLDGQALTTSGFNVDFFDLPTKSTAYAEWRMRRDLSVDIRVSPFNKFRGTSSCIAYLVDVLEHVPDPVQFLRSLCDSYEHICFNVFPHSTDDHVAVDLHYPTNHWELLPILDTTHQLFHVASSGDTTTLIWRRRTDG